MCVVLRSTLLGGTVPTLATALDKFELGLVEGRPRFVSVGIQIVTHGRQVTLMIILAVQLIHGLLINNKLATRE